MFFQLLEECITNTKIYSFGRVTQLLGTNKYVVTHKTKYCIVYTNEKLKERDWIKFIGSLSEGIFTLEYVEILRNFDICLFIRTLKQLT